MTHLRDIILKLADSNVDFVRGGGVACVLQGVERFTLDLDLSVNLNSANLASFIKVMDEVKLVPRVPVSPESLLDPEVRRMMIEDKNALVFTFIDLNDPRKHVDMFLTDDLSYEKMAVGCDIAEMDGRKVNVAGKQKLLELKEVIDPPRDKDLLDIKTLKRLLGDG